MPDDADEHDGPIKPEVVDAGGPISDATRRNAASRKRRRPPVPVPSRDEDDDDDTGTASRTGVGGRAGGPAASPRRRGSMVRAGAIAVAVLGFLTLVVGQRMLLSPDAYRCNEIARTAIKVANDDDEDFNDVDTDDRDPDDIPCEEAIALAGEIPEEEDGDDPGQAVVVPSAGSIRGYGGMVVAFGALEAVAGFFVVRTRRRTWRNVALACTAASFVIPVLGAYTLLVIAFAVFALMFSAEARESFPPVSRRPRIPPRDA